MEQETADLAAAPFSAARRRPPGRRRNRFRRGTARRLGGLVGRGADGHSAWWRNASISRAWIGGCRSARDIARVRGTRHAASETNSSVVISTNHHEPKTSKTAGAVEEGPQTPCSARYWITRSGEFGHLGSSEPVTAASARISSRISAVRIDRRVRHTRATDWRSVGPGGVVMGAPMLGSALRTRPRPRYSPGVKRCERREEAREQAREQQDADPTSSAPETPAIAR